MDGILKKILLVVAIIVLALFGVVCVMWICSFKGVTSRSEGNDTSMVAEPTHIDSLKDKTSGVVEEKNEEQPNDIEWKDSKCGFRYLSGMSYKEEYEDEVPAYFSLYTNSYSELSYSYMGAWAVFDFPEVGHYVAPGVTIAKITYKNAKRHVYSGYVSDGRIFYLKTHVDDNGEVSHLQVLTLLYNSSDKSRNEILVKEVLHSF